MKPHIRTGPGCRIAAILTFIPLILFSLLLVTGCGTETVTTTVMTTAAGDEIEAIAGDFEHVVSKVTQRVKPAVVQITNQQVQPDQFDQPFTVPAGVGSGIIYDSQGHILTNFHVIEGAQSLLISLPDGRSFPGTVVGSDPQTDIAVVQINGEGQNLPVAPLGDSNALQVGDWVVAIGNALALSGGPTVTTGVVSALGRAVQEPGSSSTGTAGPYLFDVIQTDAPINPGNSGGPLVSLQGEVIGINTLVAGSESGVQTQGIGFAISMAVARPIADELVASGKIVHPYVGIGYTPLDAAIASHLGITGVTDGALITEVVPGSPAADAGLEDGDVITEVDGVAIVGDSALASILSKHKPGDKLNLTVHRNNEKINVELTLGNTP